MGLSYCTVPSIFNMTLGLFVCGMEALIDEVTVLIGGEGVFLKWGGGLCCVGARGGVRQKGFQSFQFLTQRSRLLIKGLLFELMHIEAALNFPTHRLRIG